MEARNHWCVHRPGINLSEAFDDTIDERGLGNGNGAVGGVSDDCNPQCILRWSKIRDFPVTLKLFFEQGVFSLGRCCGEDIVNMDGKDDGPNSVSRTLRKHAPETSTPSPALIVVH
jgi:hypothetical protein